MLTRRGFLTAAAAGVAAAALSSVRPTWARLLVSPRPDASTPGRVVIVGAGLSGLTAALDLVDAGWDVVVLEARDRVGGRVHTLYDPFTDGLHAEAGGESIDDNHDQIQALVTRFGLQTEQRPPNKLLESVTYYRGQRLPITEFLVRRDGAVLSDYLRFGDALGELSADVDPVHPELAANAEELDRRTLNGFIHSLHLVPEAEFLVRLQNRAEYNAEPGELSMLFVAQQTAVVADVPDSASETMRISGGNSRLVEAIAAALGARIRLSSPVTRVEYDESGVRVYAGDAPIDAAYVILAAPMFPLRQIVFAPALPASVSAVVDGLDLGSAAKVIHQYQTRFWEAEGVPGFTVAALPFHVGWAPTDSYQSDGGLGLLTQFITGRSARIAARLSDAQRISVFQRQLDRVYPEGVPLHTPNAATMAWANEPYTGGGYAVYRPGQMAPFWPVVRDGLPRIKFAGEHTEPLAGYMESAVRSGHRVAALLGAPPVAATARRLRVDAWPSAFV